MSISANNFQSESDKLRKNSIQKLEHRKNIHPLSDALKIFGSTFDAK